MTDTHETEQSMAAGGRAEPLVGTWERKFANQWGNYYGFRFKDFKCVCEYRKKLNGMFPFCGHPKHDFAQHGPIEERECACEMCPCVEMDIDDDDTLYSEGDQPILVLDRDWRP